MTLFTNYKIPLVPLCQRGTLHNKEDSPSLKKREQERFWTRVIG